MSRHKLFQKADAICREQSCAAGPLCEHAVLTRAALFRNIAGTPFPAKLSTDEAAQARLFLEGLLRKGRELRNAPFAPIQDLDNAEQRLLGEIMFSGGFYPEKGMGISFAAAKSGKTAALLNFREHLSLFSFAAGFSPESAAETALKQEESLSKLMDFACDSGFGFLTSNHELAGSGLELSCVLHLGALHRSGRLDAALRHASAQGFAWKSLGGDGADITGDFYLLSGPYGPGITPVQAVEKLRKTVDFLVLGEKQAGEWLHRPENRPAAEDAAHRAAALLAQARLMSYEEALVHLSTAKTASLHGAGPAFPPQHELNRLVIICQPAHVALSEGRKRLVPAQRDEKRAAVLRQALGGK